MEGMLRRGIRVVTPAFTITITMRNIKLYVTGSDRQTRLAHHRYAVEMCGSITCLRYRVVLVGLRPFYIVVVVYYKEDIVCYCYRMKYYYLGWCWCGDNCWNYWIYSLLRLRTENRRLQFVLWRLQADFIVSRGLSTIKLHELVLTQRKFNVDSYLQFGCLFEMEIWRR